MDQLFRKSNDINNSSNAEDDFDDVETRPIRRRDAVEAGLDYWMDDGDLERERQRRIAVKNRKGSFNSHLLCSTQLCEHTSFFIPSLLRMVLFKTF
eukprot:scaffold570_cov169-Alexandrium_tamarense.AAC.15